MKEAERYFRMNEGCEASRLWASQYDTMQTAWDKCPNVYWMIWMLRRRSLSTYAGFYGVDPSETYEREQLATLARAFGVRVLPAHEPETIWHRARLAILKAMHAEENWPGEAPRVAARIRKAIPTPFIS